MSDRSDYHFRQRVTEGELDQGFAQLEQALWNLMLDLGKFGVVTGLVVSQHQGVPDLTVDIIAGNGYDQSGRRLRMPSLQQLSVATDSNSISTSVASISNEKYVSIFLQFDRALSDPRTDGNSQQVYFLREESFKLIVTQGSEAPIGTAVRPSLMSDAILLADVRRTFGQTQILNANITTTRRQDAVIISGSPLAIRRGRTEEAISDVVAAFNGLINGSGSTLAAAFVTYAGGPNWAGGTSATNPATNAEAQFDKIINDLAALTSGASGVHRIGSDALVGGSGTIAAGTLYATLSSLKNLSAHEYNGSGAWADATSLPASSGEVAIDSIVSNLAATGGGGGAGKIGCGARTTWLNGRVNPTTNVFSALDKIITDLASTAVGDDGAERIGIQGRATWLDGISNPATDVYAAINKVIADLSAQASGNDGAGKIGFFPTGDIAATTIRAAIIELDNEKASRAGGNTYTNTNTFQATTVFQGPVNLSGSLAVVNWRAPITVSDVNSTLDVSADIWRQTTAQAGNRTHTLRSSTSPIPQIGARIRYIRPKTTTGWYPIALQREDTTILAIVPPGDYAEVEFHFSAIGWSVADHTANVLTGE